MKRISKPETLILASLFCAGAWIATAQQTVIKRVPVQPTTSVDGSVLFHKYCAVCHGDGAKGNGPAAEALTKRPADLTQISRRHDGKFPELSVIRIISGDEVIAAHGTRDMPVWGELFAHMDANRDLGQARVYALMKYLQQIQAK